MSAPLPPDPAPDDRALLAEYRATLESLDDLIFVLDGEGCFIACHSPATAQRWLPPETFLGKHFRAVFASPSAQLMARAFGAVMAGARVEQFDFELELADRLSWWSAKITPRFHEADNRVGATMVCREITERKQLELQLQQQAEVRTQHLIRLAPGATAAVPPLQLADLFDLAEIQQIQDAFAQATGVASIITDIAGRPITRPSNFCHLCEHIIRATPQGQCNCERSDAIIGRLNHGGPVMQPCLSGGLWDGGTSICVGERHIANWLIGQVRDDSVSDETLMSYARTIGADETAYRAALLQVPRMPQATFARICQALFLIGAQLSKLAYQNFQQSQFIAERQRLEEQLRQAQKLEAVGQLAGGVAHDFNNILTAQMMHLDLVSAREDLPAEVRESLEALQTGTKMAAELTRQLLAFSRRQVLQIRRFDLGPQIAQLLKMLGRLLREDIALHFEPADAPTWVEADPGMMEQVVMNLVVNARDAMPAGGVITLRTRARDIPAEPPPEHPGARPGQFIQLTIGDTGTGMDAHIMAHLFEPFFTTKAQGHGTGLGLATVYGIVQQHHGWIEVESEPGRGSVFHVYIPAVSGPKVAPTLPAAMASVQGGGQTVLVVEDEIGVRFILERALSNLGYRVLVAEEGGAALQRWKEEPGPINLLLTDMVMPGGLSGLELARRLRRDRPDLPVIIASGYSEEMAVSGLPDEEGFHFLAKPFEISVLAGLIQRVLVEGKAAR